MRKIRKAVPITRRALEQRINRRLKADGSMLKRSVGTQARAELGPYMIVNGSSVVAEHVDLERLARRLGCLKPWEQVIE